MNKQPYRHLLIGAVVSTLLGAIPQATPAQGTAANAKEEVLEEVIVTGTSIRGINPVGSTPVQYTRADIVADAPSSIGDVLANVPQIASFGTDETVSTTNRFRTSGFIPVIHNMDIGSTLTLFNGHRMAPTGTEATFADPSIIPTIALERVEVVSDGNSAVYGSDAVAGVVNFLYRRDVDGIEADLSTTQDPNTSYKNVNASLLWGMKFDRGDVMVAYEHAKHTPALQSEIPWVNSADRRPLGGHDLRTTVCNEPRISVGMTTYSGASLAVGTAGCDPDGNLPIGFENTRDSVLATARFRPIDGVEFWGEFNYSKYKEPRTQNWTNISVTLPSTSPFYWTPPGGATAACPAGFTAPSCETVNIAAENIFGNRTQRATSKITALTAGASIDVGTSWKLDLRAHHSKTNDYWNAMGTDATHLQERVTAGTFNPFGNAVIAAGTGLNTTANSASAISYVLDGTEGYGTTNTGSQSLTELEVKADGPLFAIAGGDVKAAIGMSHRTEALRQVQDAGCPTVCSFYLRQRDDDFARGVDAAFFEVVSPFVSGANARPGIQEFTLSMAGRFDKYDKLKGQFTPKLAFNYKPIESLSFHGSWGKSFAAPNIGLTTSTFSIVQLGMNINGFSFNTYNLGGGNSFLESERAKTYSLGLDWKPAGVLDGLTGGLSYYDVQYDNIIYKPGFDDLIANPAFAGQRIVGDETDPLHPHAISPTVMAAVYAQYPPDRLLAPGQTFDLVARTYAINMYQRMFAGIDFNLGYDWDSNIGKWGVGLNGNKQTKRKTQPVKGGSISDDIDTYIAPIWSGRVQAKWSANTIPLRLTWVANYRGSYTTRLTTWNYGGGSQITHNLTVAYDLEKLFKGVTLQARIMNLMDSHPPYADTLLGYDNQNATPYGRQYNLTLHAKF